MKKRFKSSLRNLTVVCTGVAFYFPTFAAETCPKISSRTQAELRNKFNHSPLDFIESYFQISKNAGKNKDFAAQNQVFNAGFDLKKIHVSSSKMFRSKTLSRKIFSWMSNQYFNNIKKLYTDKTAAFTKHYYDLLSVEERNNLTANKALLTSFKPRPCTADEKKFLGCSSQIYVLEVQNSPEISCNQEEKSQAMKSTFYLTYSPYIGFKILDVSLSGKRILLSSMSHLYRLKEKGLNNVALGNRMTVLAQSNQKFRLPKKIEPTLKFLSQIKSQSSDDEFRMPSSL